MRILEALSVLYARSFGRGSSREPLQLRDLGPYELQSILWIDTRVDIGLYV